ncbi:MAG TPA: choice-of-anchor I family protein, partial [Caproiciproducens sp.]|nr:choice-of-anchor I family protein [Caproiciproducens sp.]
MKTKAELRKRFWALLLTASLLLSLIPVQALAANGTESPLDSFGTLLTDLGSLRISKDSNAEGGCAEIVRYNPDNRSYYVVDGVDKQLSIVNLNSLKDSKSENTGLAKTKTINFSDMAKYIPGFTFGDLTSVAIDTNRNLVAVAVQEQDYTKNGAVVLLDYDGNYIKYFPTGVQPDMVCFSPDSNYILTADEGEPRGGYAAGTTDPKGSVTLINISCGITEASGKTVTFNLFDAQRAQLVTDNVILKKGASPSADLEPEYIAVAGDKAYVTCQEANAIATLDLKTARFTSVKGLGFQDFGNVPVDVLKSDSAGIKDSANPELQPNLRGIYMPDGIAAYQAGGKTYLLTANEGDSRSWPSYTNEKKVSFKSGYKKLTCLDTSDYDGNFEAGKSYLFGGRSVSVWDADTMKQIADTGSDFETITAKANPAHFNCSNDDVEADSRSNKKGPEAEFVTTGAVDGKPYAFIGLERIGGVLAYDISSITAPKPVDYLNTRDFSAPVAGDDSPEGLDFVPAADSPNGYPLLLAANEVSGTVSMMKVGDTRYTQNRTVTIFHTNDMHGSLVTSSGSVGADYVSAMKKSVPGSLLIDAGDATQGSSFATLTQGKDVIRLMNAAGYDAMASGNHEFDYGQDPMLKNAQAAEFPIVAANILKNGAPFLKGNSYCGGSLINNGRYQIEYAQGLKIGIFGITTPETATKTNPVGIQGIDFGKNETSAVAATVQSQIDTLKNTEKCDLVIGAMHIGDDPSSDVTAKAIVAKVQGLDLLIDGHSHETEQISNISGTDGKTISVVQTGSSSKNIGEVQISWDGSKAANVTTRLITAAAVKSTYTASPFITQMASMIAGAQADQLKPVIGTTKTTLWGGTVNGINEARLAETNLGSLVADSMVWQAKQLIKDGAYKDLPVVALQNGGGVRAVIKAGNVTVGDALNVLPFGNTLAFKEITPAVLYSALENGVSGVISQDAATGKITGAAGSFPQVSGYKFTYDPRKAKGSRVTSLILENGTVLQRSDTSTKLVLASNDFELAGGDGYTMLIGLT